MEIVVARAAATSRPREGNERTNQAGLAHPWLSILVSESLICSGPGAVDDAAKTRTAMPTLYKRGATPSRLVCHSGKVGPN